MPTRPSTFSIVVRDADAETVGVTVQSKFVSADAGAVATQSFSNVAYGPDGLAPLRDTLESFRGVNNFENHDLDVLDDAVARGWDAAERTGEDRLVDAVWQGLSRLERR